MKLIDIVNGESEATSEPDVDGVRMFEALGFQQITPAQFETYLNDEISYLRQRADALNQAYKTQQLDLFATGREPIYMRDPKTRQLYRVE